EEHHAEQLDHQKPAASITEYHSSPGERENRHQIEDNKCGERYERAHQQCFGVPAKHRQHGYLHSFPAAEGIAKYGRLTEREPYVEADEHECGACQKRNSPTEAEETFVGQRVGERQKCASGQEEPQWCAE